MAKISVSLLLLLPQLLGAQAPDPRAQAQALAAWGAPDGTACGMNLDQLTPFLKARQAALAAGAAAPWSAWLLQLSAAKSPSVRSWALARRLEAGDYPCYGAFQKGLVENLLAAGYPLIKDVIGLPQGMPGACTIAPESPFWASFAKTIQAVPGVALDGGTYAVWCYNTVPSHRALVLEQAAQVKSGLSQVNPMLDPWNDRRFWITVDWALCWGAPADFQALQEALPDPMARAEFARIWARVKAIPGFWTAPPTPIGVAAPAEAAAPLEFEFRQLKITHQPPPPGYPAEAKARRLMGTVVTSIVVDATGVPSSCRVTPGPFLSFFGPTAMEYGLRWRFQPALLNGQPQIARFTLNMPFRLR